MRSAADLLDAINVGHSALRDRPYQYSDMEEKTVGNIVDKIAIVTGGSRGIGLAIAKGLLNEGAKVMICARMNSHVNQGLSDLLHVDGADGRVKGFPCDVRVFQDCYHLIHETVQQFGALDILVNNAGVGIFNDIEHLLPEQWNMVVETNLTGVYHCCHAAVPVMRERGGGWIINIGSLAGKNAFPKGTAYNASKFGLIGFSEALMQEVRHDNIRVSYVMPGSVNTEFGGETPDATKNWQLQPSDVAQVVVDLLKHDPRSLPSRVEIRPSKPPKKN